MIFGFLPKHLDYLFNRWLLTSRGAVSKSKITFKLQIVLAFAFCLFPGLIVALCILRTADQVTKEMFRLERAIQTWGPSINFLILEGLPDYNNQNG